MITPDKMVERKMVIGQGYGWVLVGVKGCVLRPTGHISVTLFSLSVSIKDQSLHKSRSKSQIYYLERILVYGCREDSLLS